MTERQATAVAEMKKPSGWQKWLMDFPIQLYRIGLGWLFGSSLIVIVHTGRKSGATRRTVLEALGHRALEGEYRVISGRGRKADWFRNIEANPPKELWVGRKRTPVTHRVLSSEEAIAAVRIHLMKYPRMSARISPELVQAMHEGTLSEALAPLEVVALRPVE